jgi:hypothetical protein
MASTKVIAASMGTGGGSEGLEREPDAPSQRSRHSSGTGKLQPRCRQFAVALEYAEQLARVAPNDPSLTLIDNLRRQIRMHDATDKFVGCVSCVSDGYAAARPVRMVAVSDFFGLMSSAWALARAAASAATVSLDRAMGGLCVQHIKTHGPRFRALGFHTMPDGLRFVSACRPRLA